MLKLQRAKNLAKEIAELRAQLARKLNELQDQQTQLSRPDQSELWEYIQKVNGRT